MGRDDLSDFEILEHTADVGLRGRGDTIEAAFVQATRALLDITGAWRPGAGEETIVEVEGADQAALLVAWLEEVLYLQDAGDRVVGAVEVDEVGERTVRGRVRVAPRGDRPLEGTAVKAITYHQLVVERTPEGWIAQAFVDV